MKSHNLIKLILIIVSIINFSACTKEDNKIKDNETKNLKLTTTFDVDGYSLEIFTKSGDFKTGYNPIYFKIKDSTGIYIQDAIVEWTPMMHMMSMMHQCPKSDITKVTDAPDFYKGFLVFQMAGNDMEYWELTFDFTINAVTHHITKKINVAQNTQRVVQVFKGTDDKKYVVSLVEPSQPKIGQNTMQAVLFQMVSMDEFTAVENFNIKIDPRMPSMSNHSSPNNENLISKGNGLYEGKVNLTMTGLWNINLQVLNHENTVLKGEAIDSVTTVSSIYFTLEF